MVEVTRKVEVLDPDGTWKEKSFMDIDVEDVVRMFEPDGEPVVMGKRPDGTEYFEAFVTKGVYLNKQKEFEGIPTFEYLDIP